MQIKISNGLSNMEILYGCEDLHMSTSERLNDRRSTTHIAAIIAESLNKYSSFSHSLSILESFANIWYYSKKIVKLISKIKKINSEQIFTTSSQEELGDSFKYLRIQLHNS